MPVHPLIPAAALLLAVTPVRAQSPDLVLQLTDGSLRIQVSDQELSWRCFASADLDADDRLDFREYSQALGQGDAENRRRSFRRLDTAPTDGFVHWNEFDAGLQVAIAREGGLVIRPQRPLLFADIEERVAAEANTRSAPGLPLGADPVRAAMALFDDGDQTMGEAEIGAMLDKLGLDASLASYYSLVDANGSGGLEADELLVLLQRFPALGAALPGLLAAGDGGEDESEPAWKASLRALDPRLERWSRQLAARAARATNETSTGR